MAMIFRASIPKKDKYVIAELENLEYDHIIYFTKGRIERLKI